MFDEKEARLVRVLTRKPLERLQRRAKLGIVAATVLSVLVGLLILWGIIGGLVADVQEWSQVSSLLFVLAFLWSRVVHLHEQAIVASILRKAGIGSRP